MANVTAKDFHVTGFKEEAKEAKGLNGYSYTDICLDILYLQINSW